MSRSQSSPTPGVFAPLRAAARLVFLVVAIGVISTALFLTGLLPGAQSISVEEDPLAPIQPAINLLAVLPNLVILVVCLRFALPLLSKEAPAADILERSLRRMALMWRVLGITAVVGLLAGLSLVLWVVVRTV